MSRRVVVIGGGIVGCATAYFAARAGMQVTPVIAIAPQVVIWAGLDHPERAIISLAVIVAFFPIFSGALTGLKSTDPDLERLFDLYEASRWQRLWRLRIPSSIPFVLEGHKVLVQARGLLSFSDVPFKGYEMHVGRTTSSLPPLLTFADGRDDYQCWVSDISQDGAKISADMAVKVGSRFDIAFVPHAPKRSCEVVWCRGKTLGVKFVS